MTPDLIIIGSGMGGVSLAATLARTCHRILVLERGKVVQPWPAQTDALLIFRRRHFRPFEPMHSGRYFHPPVLKEPAMANLRRRLQTQGPRPASLPLRMDLPMRLAGEMSPGRAFRNTAGGKMIAESVRIAQGPAHPNVTLRTECQVLHLIADATGQVTRINLKGGETLHVPMVVLTAGTVKSATVLLRSRVANASDQVGRNFLSNVASAVLAFHPFRQKRSAYQKTLILKDFYPAGGTQNAALAIIQLRCKIAGPKLAANSTLPVFPVKFVARRTVDLNAIAEDLSDLESRAMQRGESLVKDWRQENRASPMALVATMKALLRRVGDPVGISKPLHARTPSHQFGTVRMGRDPSSCIVDVFCGSHHHPNLFITDASVLLTSATASFALWFRAADHIITTDFAA